MSLVETNAGGTIPIDQAAILRALNLNPNDPKTQALLLVCDRYGLDPLLKHMVLISGNPYITRDGLLHVAHRSGQLDGIEVLDEGDDNNHWWARVAVYRKDMNRPFTYRGRYPKTGHLKQYGPEMAIKVAEVMALRRAFSVTGIAVVEEQWDTTTPDAFPDDILTDFTALDSAAQAKILGWAHVTDIHDAPPALWDRLRGVIARAHDTAHQASRPDGVGVADDLAPEAQAPLDDAPTTGIEEHIDTPGPAAGALPAAGPGPLRPLQRKMHALAGQAWPDQRDRDRNRHGIISALTDGRYTSSNDIDDDCLSDVCDALQAIIDGNLELHQKATGEWDLRQARSKRGAA